MRKVCCVKGFSDSNRVRSGVVRNLSLEELCGDSIDCFVAIMSLCAELALSMEVCSQFVLESCALVLFICSFRLTVVLLNPGLVVMNSLL